MLIAVVLLVIFTITSSQAIVVPCNSQHTLQPSTVDILQNSEFTSKFSTSHDCTYTLKGAQGYWKYVDCNILQFDTCTLATFTANTVAWNCPTNEVFRKRTSKTDLVVQAKSTGSQGVYNCSVWLEVNPCDCGRTQVANTNIYTYQARIKLATSATVICGATLITYKDAVTSATCVSPYSTAPTALSLDVGIDSADAKLYPIQEVRIYSQYQATTQLNDLAIVRTAAVIQLNSNVGVACLLFNMPDPATTTQTFPFRQVSATNSKNVNTLLVRSPAACVDKSRVCTSVTSPNGCTLLKGSSITFVDASSPPIAFFVGVTTGFQCTDTSTGLNQPVAWTNILDWIRQNSAIGTSFCEKVFKLGPARSLP